MRLSESDIVYPELPQTPVSGLAFDYDNISTVTVTKTQVDHLLDGISINGSDSKSIHSIFRLKVFFFFISSIPIPKLTRWLLPLRLPVNMESASQVNPDDRHADLPGSNQSTIIPPSIGSQPILEINNVTNASEDLREDASTIRANIERSDIVI